GVVLVGAGVVRQHGGCRLGRGVLGVDTHLGVVDRVRVGLCGLFRVGLTGAAGPHGLGRRTSGDGLDGVGYGPVLGGGAAVGEHTDDVSTGGLSDLHDLRNQRHPILHPLGGPKAFRRLDAPIQAWRSARVKPLVCLEHQNEEREEKPQMARPEPLYIRPANWVRQQIRDGVLAPGMSAPTERELAKQFGISRDTAGRSLELLVSEGLLTPGNARAGRRVRNTRVLPIHASRSEQMERRLSAGVDAWVSDTQDAGREPGQTIDVSVVQATEEVATWLEI